ncbi:hypothetical protein [Burkholderia sp. Ax-1724]|uniref:hypothetical protein n=1 Tax=Burkholderia sp. Ax-1724 TaxID=2608336 RepID=UPI00141F4F2A|nr:hypothetical protein [Burkholderia sp. Ax-1724]NIF53576.1 hypothetical protein [Burkholderia sp. Ax-1724]
MSILIRDLGSVSVHDAMVVLVPCVVGLQLFTAFLGGFFALLVRDCWVRLLGWVESRAARERGSNG